MHCTGASGFGTSRSVGAARTEGQPEAAGEPVVFSAMNPPEAPNCTRIDSTGAGFSGDWSAAVSQQESASEDARLTNSQRIVQVAQSANTINATNGFSRFTRSKNSLNGVVAQLILGIMSWDRTGRGCHVHSLSQRFAYGGVLIVAHTQKIFGPDLPGKPESSCTQPCPFAGLVLPLVVTRRCSSKYSRVLELVLRLCRDQGMKPCPSGRRSSCIADTIVQLPSEGIVICVLGNHPSGPIHP